MRLLFGESICLCPFLFELRKPVAGIFQLVKTALSVRKQRSEPLFVCGILLFQTAQLRKPLLQPVVFFRRKVQKLLFFAEALGGVLYREPRAADDLFRFREIGAPRAGAGDIILCIAALCNSAAVGIIESCKRGRYILRQLFAVAKKIAPLHKLRLFTGAQLRFREFGNTVAQAFFQTLLFRLIHRETFGFADKSTIGIVRLAV